ncbi:MAG TPA: hypothetical protein VIK18_21535, partial [Pirellulales bacterium]
YQQRLELDTDLGILELDERGMWVPGTLDRVVASMPTAVPLPPPIPDEWFQDAELTPPPKDGSDEPPPEPLPLPADKPEADKPEANEEPIPAPKPVVKPLGGGDPEQGPTVLRLVVDQEPPNAAAASEADAQQADARTDRWPLPQKSAQLRRKNAPAQPQSAAARDAAP